MMHSASAPSPRGGLLRGLSLLTVTLLTLHGPQALARVIQVGPSSPEQDLQTAIDGSGDGDVILVHPGVYELERSLNFEGRKITVQSVQGPEVTVLRMASSGDDSRGSSVVVFNHQESHDSVLEGFTLEGGQGVGSLTRLGGGIYIRDASPLIRNCRIQDNESTLGGGIYLYNSRARIQDCELTSNRAGQHGGGVYVHGGEVELVALEARNNIAHLGGGGVTAAGSSVVNLEGSRLEGNRSAVGGGIELRDAATGQVVSSLVVGNRADEGAGIQAESSSEIVLVGSTVATNETALGAAVQVGPRVRARIVNSILAENSGVSLHLAPESIGTHQLTSSLIDRTSGFLPDAARSQVIVHRPHFIRPGHFETVQGESDPVWVSGDYRLASDSPAIDAATTSPPGGVEVPAVDLDRKIRARWNGMDIGAHEYSDSKVPEERLQLRLDTPVVFVEREHEAVRVIARRDRAIETASRGRLVLLETSGEVVPLVDAEAPGAPPETPTDVMDPDVNADGTLVVFAGFSPSEQSWRIYQVGIDGAGLRQVTSDTRTIDLDRYGETGAEFEKFDDLDPCFLPDGGICFVSTRYVGSAPDHRQRATNLYVLDAGADSARRLTSERFGADTPIVDPTTGLIVYSRWWRSNRFDLEAEGSQGTGLSIDPIPLGGEPDADVDQPSVPVGSPGYGGEVSVPRPGNGNTASRFVPSGFSEERLRQVDEDEFPGVNSWFLATIRPDGTDMKMLTGFHLDREATQAYRPSFQEDGKALALFLPVTPLLGQPGVFGLRRFDRGPSFPEALGGPQRFAGSSTSRQQDFEDRQAPNFDFVYSSAEPLAGSPILVTGAFRDVENRQLPDPSDYNLFVQEESGTPVVAYQGEDGLSVLDAVWVRSRPTPPVVAIENTHSMRDDSPQDPGQAHREGGTFRFTVENIWANAEVDVPIPNAPTFGSQALFIEFYMAPQRLSFIVPDMPLLLHRQKVPLDGRVSVELPASVPLFEMLRLEDGTVAQGRDGQIFHVGGMNFARAGSEGKCIGCHAGHSMVEVPEDPSVFNLAPSAVVKASSMLISRQVGLRLRPEFLVDRSTNARVSDWASQPGDERPTVQFNWDVPVRMDEVVLHGVRESVPGRPDASVNFRVEEVRVRVLDTRGWNDIVVHSGVLSTGGLDETGMAFSLDGAVGDRLEIEVTRVAGSFLEGSQAAFSEVQVLGSVISEEPFHYLRADADCNGQVEMNDPLSTLSYLFLEGSAPCCEAASDANGDGSLNISDPITTLHYLYLGGTAPPAPFPSCGPHVQVHALDDLGCEQPTEPSECQGG